MVDWEREACGCGKADKGRQVVANGGGMGRIAASGRAAEERAGGQGGGG